MHADRNAAKHVLRSLDQPASLAENPLLDAIASVTHEERRAVVLRALDRLNPGAAIGVDADRKRRKHTIIVRCDVQGEQQDAVAAELGLSMRQFFRERGEAFEEFVDALKGIPPASKSASQDISTDAFAMRERLIQKLRGCGEHHRVWTEASSFAFELGSEQRAIEFWTVAAEAARYMSDLGKSSEAIAEAKRVAHACGARRGAAADILVAIPEIALDWTRARYHDASDRLEQLMQRCSYGKTLFGLDATLFGIMLTYGISIEIERGRWDRANTLLRHLDETTARSDSRHTSPSLRRHAGRVALRSQRDRARAIVELQEALAAAQRFDNLAAEASAAVDLGVALAETARDEALRYIRYGLDVARKVLGRNEFAMLALGALPAICSCIGIDEAAQCLEEITAQGPLADRAQLALNLAEVAVLLHRRAYRSVLERAQPLADVLENRGLIAPAGEAMLMAVTAQAQHGRPSAAKRLFSQSADLIRACGETTGWSAIFGSNVAVARN